MVNVKVNAAEEYDDKGVHPLRTSVEEVLFSIRSGVEERSKQINSYLSESPSFDPHYPRRQYSKPWLQVASYNRKKSNCFESHDTGATQVSKESSSISTNVSRSISTNVPKSISTNVSKSISTNVSKSISTNVSKSISTNVSKSISTNVSKSIPNNISKCIPTNISKCISTRTSKHASTSISNNVLTNDRYGYQSNRKFEEIVQKDLDCSVNRIVSTRPDWNSSYLVDQPQPILHYQLLAQNAVVPPPPPTQARLSRRHSSSSYPSVNIMNKNESNDLPRSKQEQLSRIELLTLKKLVAKRLKNDQEIGNGSYLG